MEKIQAGSLVASVNLGLRSIKEDSKCNLRMDKELSSYRNRGVTVKGVKGSETSQGLGVPMLYVSGSRGVGHQHGA